jgi:hypothetical protein
MRRKNSLAGNLSHWLLRFSLTTLMGGLFTVSATAQPPAVSNAVRIVVKPDRTAEFLEIQGKFTEAFKEGGGQFRGVWRNVNNRSEFVVVTPRDSYAAYDSPGPGSKVMSEAESARLIARYVQCLQSREQVMRTPVEGLSITPPETPKMVHTITTRVRIGKGPQFQELIKELFEVYKKVGLTGYGMSQTQYGGPRNEFMSWRPIEKMADLDGQSWAAKAFESMGEDAAQKWMDGYRDTIESAEHDIYSYVPEISYYPEP